MKIVLLPGLDGTGVHFQPFLNEMPSRWEATVFRYPTESSQDYATLTEYVAQRLPREEPFCLLAESFSGPIAYRLAASGRFPIESVIFVATFLRSPRPRLLRLRHLLPLRWLLQFKAPDWILRRLMLDVQTSDEFLTTFWLAVEQVRPEVLVQRLGSIAALPSGQAKLKQPCLYLQASHDLLVPRRSVEDFKQVCPDLEVVQIPGRHFLLQAKPKPCVEAIERWLAEQTRFDEKA
ncbi:MAG: alpha/beta fold hydrolase [Caldilineaceae bacterium]